MNRLTISLLLLAMTQVPVRAALFAENSAFGNNTITFDDATGLRWLDLTVTMNISYDDMQTRLAPSGQFEGYRYATSAEVNTLFANAGSAWTLLALLGQTYYSVTSGGGGIHSYHEYRVGAGFVGPSTRGFYRREEWYEGIGGNLYVFNTTNVSAFAYTLNTPYPAEGHYLVQATATPEPATAGLLAVAMAALWPRRRR